MNEPAAGDIAALLKAQQRRLVAHLARSLGLAHLALAEDAVQVAALQALQSWPGAGWPDNPAGWLYRVARHHALDQLRREQHQLPLPEDDGLPLPAPMPAQRLAGELDDDELALLFAACHPALPVASQVALAMRAVAGLELAAIAEGLFTNETALAQRLARARALLQGQPLALPAGAELPARREAVLITLQLMFAAGLRASGRQVVARAERPGDEGPAGPAWSSAPLQLCWEAIRLARALAAHPHAAHADADALAALLLLHGARLSGRLDEAGQIVPLPGQDRDRWDVGLVRLGLAHLQASQRGLQLSRWHLLAGVAAEHALAPSYACTDWPSIVRYYGLLLQQDPSAAPRLGHAIALVEGGSPAQALALLERLLPDTPEALRAHTLAALSRAHERLAAWPEAVARLKEAIACAPSAADARWLTTRLQALQQQAARP